MESAVEATILMMLSLMYGRVIAMVAVAAGRRAPRAGREV